MDWTWKHFRATRTLAHPPAAVAATARAVMEEALGQGVRVVPGGFDAEGHMAARKVLARFRLAATPGGTRIAIELLAERSGGLGFRGYMLFEPFGFFRGRMRHWLDAISERLEGRPGSLEARHPLRDRVFGAVMIGSVLIILLYFVWTVISLLSGLLTGDLYLSGRNGAAGITIHGIWARVTAGAILAGLTLLVLLARRRARGRQRPRILGP